MPDTRGDLVAISDTDFISSAAPVGSRQAGSVFNPFRTLRRYPLAASLTAISLLIAGGILLKSYLRPVYSAQSVVYVAPSLPSGLSETHDHDRVYEDFINQQISAVTRRDNLQAAVRQFHDYWVAPHESEISAVDRLEKALKVQQMNRGYQISITLQSARPGQLADFVNKITSGYLEDAHKDEFFGQQERIAALKQTRAELTAELDSNIHEQDQLLRSLGMAQFDAKGVGNPYDTQLQKLRDQLAEAHAKRAAADAVATASLSRNGGTGTPVDDLAATQIYGDPGVAALVSQLSNRRGALVTQMSGLTPANPLYVQSKAELDTIDEQLSSLKAKATGTAVGQITNKLTSDRQSASLLENTLGADLKRTESLANEAGPKLLRAQVLSNNIDRIELNYAQVDQRITSLLLDANSPGSEHIVSWAVPPSSPVAKHTVLYLAGLLLLSFIGALIVSYIMDSLDANIYTGQDVQRLIGFPPIGVLLDEADFSAVMRSEYLVRIAGGIDQAHRRTGARSFLFTSAGQGEARALVSELGPELVANGFRTLVLLPQQDSPNGTYAAGNASTQESRDTATGTHKRTAILPVSKVDDDESMLSVLERPKQALAETVRTAGPLYDVLLIAGDPLLSSAHTEHLARTADGTVLIIESGSVNKKQLGRAARLLERLKIPGVAVVLSHVTRDRADADLLANEEEYARVQNLSAPAGTVGKATVVSS